MLKFPCVFEKKNKGSFVMLSVAGACSSISRTRQLTYITSDF
jgi:hypothetical protein